MSEDGGVFNGKVSVRHTIEYCEEMDAKEYYLRNLAYLLTDDEYDKVIKYIKRLTSKRIDEAALKMGIPRDKRKFYARKIFPF